MTDSLEQHHLERSEFIRALVQRYVGRPSTKMPYTLGVPKTIVQFWNDLKHLPDDVKDCIASWSRWEVVGYKHCLFDEQAAKDFISNSLGIRHVKAFERCYHPAMQADYFRLCYLLVEGGFYVDADDACVTNNIDWLFEDGMLKLQPLCYDIVSNGMVKPSVFLCEGAYEPSWIFYFNNNPIIVSKGHPIIARALNTATDLLESIEKDLFPEIQSTTGPGNLSKSIFELGVSLGNNIESNLVVLHDWDSIALSRWPLSYREDARNWRLSNQVKFFLKRE